MVNVGYLVVYGKEEEETCFILISKPLIFYQPRVIHLSNRQDKMEHKKLELIRTL
jgi:hypothetical protein